VGFSHFTATEESMDDLVEVAQADISNDSIAMGEIVRRFDGKALKIAKFATNDYHLGQDIANAARWGVVMAVRAHTPGKPGFASYVEQTMRGEAYRAFSRNTSKNEIVVADEAAIWTSEPTFREDASVVETNLAMLTQGLTTEQRRLVDVHYGQGYGVSEIAFDVGTSVSAVSQRFKTIHRIVGITAVELGISAA